MKAKTITLSARQDPSYKHAVQGCVKYSLCNLICLNVYQSPGRLEHIIARPHNRYSSPACLPVRPIDAHRGICQLNYYLQLTTALVICAEDPCIRKLSKTQLRPPIMQLSAEYVMWERQKRPISCVLEIDVDRRGMRKLGNNTGRLRTFSCDWQWAQYCHFYGDIIMKRIPIKI